MSSQSSTPSLSRASLDSSSLLSVGYSGESGIMEIAFQNGSLYRYFAVPPDVHEALLTASSKGRYFNTAIRSRFRFERLRTATPRRPSRPTSPPAVRGQGHLRQP